MTHPENDTFGDFEGDFQSAKKAEHGTSLGTVPEGTYKVACCNQDITGNAVLVDHEIFTATSGTKGFKLFLEILSPEVMVDKATGEKVKVKGEVIEHVFWVTQKNLAYIKRDIAAILGRDLKNLSELTSIVWLGKTCEVGVKHEVYRGFKQSRVSYFNPWNPDAEKKSGKDAPKDSSASAATSEAPAGGTAPGKEDQGDPNF